MVVADEPASVVVKLWANVLQADARLAWTLVFNRTITTGEPFALPSGYLSQEFQAQIETASPVQGLLLAEDVDDLA
jgi:hypothetical protein